ncbi:MAG TPA: hypothetical protein VMW27_24455 [Thermoanaerobaculia bacterium]|nr:hypothetical protein [Thermoanaerobaculia bacterium]
MREAETRRERQHPQPRAGDRRDGDPAICAGEIDLPHRLPGAFRPGLPGLREGDHLDRHRRRRLAVRPEDLDLDDGGRPQLDRRQLGLLDQRA